MGEPAADGLAVDFLFALTLKGACAPQHPFATPWGDRRLTRAAGGSFVGPRIWGQVIQGLANDWGAAGDGYVGIDAQVVLRTHDGTPILASFYGRVDADGRARISPVFEVDAGPYGWLNEIQALGVGGPRGEDLQFDVYAMK